MLLKKKINGSIIKMKSRLKYHCHFNKNDNENTTIKKNLWNAAKAVLRGKFIAIQAFLKRKKKKNLTRSNIPLKRIRKKKNKQKLNSEERRK